MVHESRTRWNPAIAALKRGQRGTKPKLDLSSYAIDEDIDLGLPKSADEGAEGGDAAKKLPRTRTKRTTAPKKFKSYAGPAPNITLVGPKKSPSSQDYAKAGSACVAPRNKDLLRTSSDFSKTLGATDVGSKRFSKAKSLSGEKLMASTDEVTPPASPSPSPAEKEPQNASEQSSPPDKETKEKKDIAVGDALKTVHLKQQRRNSAIECAAAGQLLTTKNAMKASAQAAAEESKLRATKKNKKASAVAAAEASQMLANKKNIRVSALAAATRSRALTANKLDESPDPVQAQIDKAKENLDPAVRAKIDKIFDPRTPLRERVATEIHLKKDPELASLISELKYLNGRKMKVQKRQEQVESNERQKLKNLEEEAMRSAEEKARLERERQELQRAAAEEKERQEKFNKKLRSKMAKTIVDDYEKIRQDAEEAKRIAEIKREEKERLAKERRAYIESELAQEENDVKRNLKEAWLESLMDKHETSL